MAFLRLQKRLLGESETLQKNDFFLGTENFMWLKKKSTYMHFQNL